MRRHFAILAIMLLSLTASAQVTARLDSTRMQVGGHNRLTIEVKARNGARIEWPQGKDKMLTPQLEIIGEQGDTATTDGQTTYARHYNITVWDEGIITVPALPVSVDGKKSETQPIPLHVLTVKVDTIHPSNIKPPHDTQATPFCWDDWWPLYALSFLVLLLMGMAWYLYTRLRENKPVISHIFTAKHEPPHQKALRRITEIKAARQAESINQKEYYTELTNILRRYMSERFGFNAMEMTSQEIITRLAQEQSQEKIEELRDLFTTADLVKFARHHADRSKGVLYLSNVMHFIEETHLNAPTEEAHVEQPITREELSKRRRRLGVRVAMLTMATAAVALTAYVLTTAYTLLF